MKALHKMHWLLQNSAALSCMSEIIALVRLCVTSMTMTDACRVNSFDASLSCFCYSALTLKAAKLGRFISESAFLCILACVFTSIYESEAIKGDLFSPMYCSSYQFLPLLIHVLPIFNHWMVHTYSYTCTAHLEKPGTTHAISYTW